MRIIQDKKMFRTTHYLFLFRNYKYELKLYLIILLCSQYSHNIHSQHCITRNHSSLTNHTCITFSPLPLQPPGVNNRTDNSGHISYNILITGQLGDLVPSRRSCMIRTRQNTPPLLARGLRKLCTYAPQLLPPHLNSSYI